MFVTRRRETRRSVHVARLAFVLVGLLSFAITGCVESRARYTPVPATPTSTPIPLPTATMVPPTPTSTPIPTATPVPTATPTAVPTVIPTEIVVSTTTSGTFNLTLDFEGDSDGLIVHGDTFLIGGVTSADAIVSVNDVIVEVQPDGSFELTVVLKEGPNFVDVVASNLGGLAISYQLEIVSIPPDDAV